MIDYADKSAYGGERWLPSRDECVVMAYCAAFTLCIAAIDWLL